MKQLFFIFLLLTLICCHKNKSSKFDNIFFEIGKSVGKTMWYDSYIYKKMGYSNLNMVWLHFSDNYLASSNTCFYTGHKNDTLYFLNMDISNCVNILPVISFSDTSSSIISPYINNCNNYASYEQFYSYIENINYTKNDTLYTIIQEEIPGGLIVGQEYEIEIKTIIYSKNKGVSGYLSVKNKRIL